MPYGVVSYGPTVLCPMVLESYVLYGLMPYGLVSYGHTVLCPMVLCPVLCPMVLLSCPMVLLSCPMVLLSYVLCRQWDIKPGLHSMQKAQFNTKCKIGFISLLNIKINVILCMLSVKDPKGPGMVANTLP